MRDMENVASKMKHRVTFQSEVLTSDGIGGNSISWTNFTTVWASIDSLSSHSGRSLNAEKNFAGGINEIKPVKITIRYISGISSNMRIMFDSRVFNIRSVVNVDEKNEILQIFAEEGVTS